MKAAFRFALVVFLLALLPLIAQPPAPPNPQAPAVAALSATGAQRGQTFDLTLTGTNLQDPTGVWLSFPGKATIPTDANNGKTPTTLKVKVEVPKDAPLGFHALRLATKRGMSNTRLFCIDDLPEVAEAANNRDVKSAQALNVPCVVSGRADAEATDYFKITVKAKQRLSFEVLGRRLGSALDPQITLLDGNGKELPGAFSNDAPGLQTDCRLSYVFENAGDAYIAVRDVSYAGGPTHHYRLRVGDFPLATTPLPLAIKRGGKAQINFAGPAVEGVAAVEVEAPADPTIESLQIAPKSASGIYGWPVVLHISDLDEQMEKEPNNDAKQANRIEVPSAITARFEQKDDPDCFVFKAQKGKRYQIDAHASEHLSPTEVYMVLKNDKGAQVLASNPMTAPRLDFTAPADGDYTLTVEHLHSWGGPDEVYRISVTPFAPSFTLTLAIDRWDVVPGGKVSVPIFANRAGYTGPIEVSVVGPKGMSGTVTIPTGAPKAPNQAAATLPIDVTDLPTGPVSFAIQGKATIDGKPVTTLASVRAPLVTALGNLQVPPKAMTTQLGLAVLEKPPFALATKFEPPSVMPEAATEATITVTRQPGFEGEVAITFQGLPPGVKLEPPMLKVPGKETSTKVKLTPPANVKPMSYPVIAVGTSKHDGRDWSVRADAVPLVVMAKKK